jgi:hypothetical protein
MNARAAGEVLEHGDAVIADGANIQTAAREFFFFAFQLDELAFAVRSPVGRTDEHEHEALRPMERGEGLAAAVLIGGLEAWDPRADIRAGVQRCGREQEQPRRQGFTTRKPA